MPITSTAPAQALPGWIHRPGLAAWNVAVACGVDGHAGDLAGRRIDAARHVGRDHAARGARDRLDHAGERRPAARRWNPVAEQRVDRSRRPSSRPGSKASGGSPGAAAAARRVAAERIGRLRQTSASRPACAAGARRRAVAAVVALAADDRRSGRRGSARRPRARGPSPPAPSAPATGSRAPRSPSGRSRASPPRRAAARARPDGSSQQQGDCAAIPLECVSETVTSTPSSLARAAARPDSRTSAASPPTTSTSCQSPSRTERLRDRLLGAEARGEVPAGSPRSAAKAALGVR